MLKKIKKKYQEHKVRRAHRREERRHLINAPSAYDEAILSWVAPETIRHDRGKVWKIVMSFIVLTAMVLGFLFESWTFSLAIFAFAVTYYLVNMEHPKDVEIKISNIGIKVGSRKYPYNRIKSFWIIYESALLRTLNIRISGDILTDISIELDGQNPSPVRDILIEKIPELEGKSENLSNILLRLFKI